MTGLPRHPRQDQPLPPPGAQYVVPNPLIPDPVTLACTQCGTDFICNASFPAAQDRACSMCAIPGLSEPMPIRYA